MQKFHSILILLLITNIVFSQSFDWLSSSPKAVFLFPVMNDNNTISLVVENENKREIELFDAIGKSYNRFGYYTIVNYSLSGNVNRITQIRSQDTEVKGMAAIPNSGPVFLTYVEKDYTGRFYLNFLNPNGKLTKTLKCDLSHFARVSDFKRHPNGGFIISGFIKPGKLCDSLDNEVDGSGGNFILKIDEKGQAIWADIVANQYSTCCTIGRCKTSISQKGTIYLAGNYKNGGFFGGKTLKLSPMPYTTDKRKEFTETYLAAYSSSGELLWVRTAKCYSNFKSVFATDNNIHIGYNIYAKFDKPFGRKIDTTNKKNMIVTVFSPEGSVIQSTSYGADHAKGLYVDDKNILHILGTFRDRTRFAHNIGTIGNYTLDDDDKIFIVSFNKKMRSKGILTTDLPISTRFEDIYFLFDSTGEIYIIGLIFCGGKIKLSRWDKAFKAGVGNGGIAFIGKVKKSKK